MRSARSAELLDGELLGHGALVLVGVVVGTATAFAGKLDEISHGVLLCSKIRAKNSRQKSALGTACCRSKNRGANVPNCRLTSTDSLPWRRISEFELVLLQFIVDIELVSRARALRFLLAVSVVLIAKISAPIAQAPIAQAQSSSHTWESYTLFLSTLREFAAPLSVETPTTFDVEHIPPRTALVFLGAEQTLPARLLVQHLAQGGRIVVFDEHLDENELFKAFHIDVLPIPVDAAPLMLRGDARLAIAESSSNHPLTVAASRLVTNRARVLYHSELDAIYRIGQHPFVFSGAVGNGRLIAIADASLVIDNMLEFEGNRQFARNLAGFLRDGADRILVIAPGARVLGADPAPVGMRGRLREALARLARMDAPPAALMVVTVVLCLLLALMFFGVVPSRSPYTSTHMVDPAPSPMGASGELAEAADDVRVDVARALFLEAWERDRKGTPKPSVLRIVAVESGRRNSREGIQGFGSARSRESFTPALPSEVANDAIEKWKRNKPQDRHSFLRWMDEGVGFLSRATSARRKPGVVVVPVGAGSHAETIRAHYLAVEARKTMFR